ncbi:hypothetical protein ACMXYW_09070 [Neptuniibacter sp. QD48_55]|uniref:hypothetical protein n=1 Tax=Neptuniibacter sp. QD48_55 TaxID=3398212 RepID=UPI0039F4C7E9
MKLLAVILFSFFLWGCGQKKVVEKAPAAKAKGWDGVIHNYTVWPDRVQETSGLASHDGLLWTINDSGDGPYLYALDAQHNIVKVIKVENAKNIDWEELAQDESFLYIADCGNNRGRRIELQIYKVAWKDLESTRAGGVVSPEVLKFRYADRPAKVAPKSHNFDCEALTVVNNELWLFTKNRENEQTHLYKLDKSEAEQSVTLTERFDVEGLVTAADYDPVTKRLALLGYAKQKIFGHSFLWVVPMTDAPNWEEARRTYIQPYAQWEALVWDRENNGRLVLSTEKSLLLDVGVGELNLTVPTEIP